jgi:hypothetical protein
MKTEPNHPINQITHNDGSKVSLNDVADASNYYCMGLSKREYFAAIALQGIIAGCDSHFQPELFAEYAVRYADALIKELNK